MLHVIKCKNLEKCMKLCTSATYGHSLTLTANAKFSATLFSSTQTNLLNT